MTVKKIFTIRVNVDKPVLIGQDDVKGRRQLVPITGGTLEGADPDGNILKGDVLSSGVDSQIIRPDGVCVVSARYGVKLDNKNGSSFYVENNGIRTVPAEYADIVKNGGFVDSILYYFCTSPKFEVFGEDLSWIERKMWFCSAVRKPNSVLLDYYMIMEG